jgi:hypothetical protein
MAQRRFEVRRRSFDGKFLRWEYIAASHLGMLRETVRGVDGRSYKPADYDVAVVVGVFDSRKAAFNG